MKVDNRFIDKPFFSICIPQYNRTSFLIEVCKSLAAQSFRNFEVCISDDRSTDGKEDELISFLKQSRLSFVYRKQEENTRYDGNLRSSIELSRGEYCFLLGNDDALAFAETLQDIYDEICKVGPVGVAITNYEGFVDGKVMRRIARTGLLGSGPIAAANNYRNVSFVSGVILSGAGSRSHATNKWDGSEMYQMYLMCRILGEGRPLLGVDMVAIRKDIFIEGEQVDSYAAKPRLRPCPLIERRHTFHFLGRLVVDAIAPYLDPTEKQQVSEKVIQQLLVFTYPFWLFEFRRVQSWKYAAGVCLGMRPHNFLEGITLSKWRRLRVTALYIVVSILGLTTPTNFFKRLYPQLHMFAKSGLGRFVFGAKAPSNVL